MDVIRQKETLYIHKFKPKYNILKFGDSSLGYKHTKKTKNKLKQKWNKNPIRKEQIRNLNLNKKFNIETIEKMKQNAKNRTQEHKENHNGGRTRPSIEAEKTTAAASCLTEE